MSIKNVGALLFFSSCLATAWAQALIIPQVVDGDVWQTTIVLTNTTAAAANANLNFFVETSAGATQSWNLPFLETSSTQSISLAAGETLLLHSPGTAAVLSVGWGQIIAGPGVAAYAIFTKRPPGLPAQVGTAPAMPSAGRILVPFDNTSGNVAAMALVNSSASPETISVNLRTTGGTITQGTLANIPAQGHIAFTFPQQFAATAGQSGLAEFYTTSGTFSSLALSFNPAGSLTTAPVYLASGPPIIANGTGTGTPLPLQGKAFTLVGSMVISGKTLTVNMQVIPGGDQSFVEFDDNPSVASGVGIILGMNAPLSVSGNTATFQSPNVLSILTSIYTDTTNVSQVVIANITAATINVTFTSLAVGSPLTGTVDFTIAGLSTPNGTTVQGSFTGTLTQITQF